MHKGPSAAADYLYTYSYDRLGNITGRTGTDPDMTYTYGTVGGSPTVTGGPQAVTRVDNSTGTDWSYDYDARGNLDGKYQGTTLTHDYTFDVENRLASVRTGNETMSFVYDADGQRVKTTLADGTILYTPFPDYEVEVPTSGATTTRTTYRLAGQIVAVQHKLSTGAATFYYTYSDHLGNVAALSTTSGTFVAGSLARHDPFGNYRTTPATTVNPTLTDHGFTGHRMNNTGSFPTQNVGLIYMNARYYLPEVGRFISPDSIVPEPGNPQSYNRYSYGFNNPVKYVDPSGHCGAEAAASGDDSYYVGMAEYQECLGLKHELEGLLGHTISGIWYLWQMQAMYEGGFSLAAQGLSLGPSLTSSEHRAALLALTQYWAQTDVTSLEISARVVEFGFVLGSTIEDLIAVLSGHEGTGLVGRSPSEVGDFSSGKVLGNRDSGFNDFYGDPDPANNQVHHTWFWIQMGYYHDYFTAMAGNIWHEIDPSANQGRSWSDFRVGVWGIAAGSELKNGQLDLFDLAQDLRVFLGR